VCCRCNSGLVLRKTLTPSVTIFSCLLHFYIHPGLNLQRSAGCNCSSSTDREVPADCQLERGGRVQNGTSIPLEGSAQRHRGGWLRETSGRVLPGGLLAVGNQCEKYSGTTVSTSVIHPPVSQVIIRGGGHILPYDQPARSFDMIDRFLSTRGWV